MKDPDGKEGKDTGGASSSSSPGASSSASPAAAARVGPQAGRADSQDDVSTNAPSEAGEDVARRQYDDNVSEWESESGFPSASPAESPGESSASAAQAIGSESSPVPPILEEVQEEGIQSLQEVHVIEATPDKRSKECNLCSMLDCLKMSRGTARTDEADIIIERTKAKAEAKPKAARRVFRPYRMPFPGTPVDPASVGLAPGPGDLVRSQ